MKQTQPALPPRPRLFGCPMCGAHGDGQIIQWGNVSARWWGEFDADGEWVDDGNGADMEWDTSEIENYFCRVCDKPFDAPALLDADGKPTETRGEKVGTPLPSVVVTIEGGLVASVTTDRPLEQVLVIDFDQTDEDGPEYVSVPQEHGEPADAAAHWRTAEVQPERVAHLCELVARSQPV